MSELKMEAFNLMDKIVGDFQNGEIENGMTNLTLGLQDLRKNGDSPDWIKFAQNDFLSHKLTDILLQDPFTKHSFEKPRKYSGDADLIDYMYGLRKPTDLFDETASRIFDYTTNTPAPESVRERRTIIAEMIDELSQSNDDLRILSIACGHLREAAISNAVQNGKVSEYFAFDQDEMSLQVVKNELSNLNVTPIHAPIKSLFTNGHEFQNLDFVYAAGLFDYLTQSVAAKLTAKMFGMLKPGGKLLVANFAPCLRDIAYMETFMQWKLIYRNETEVAEFTSLITPKEIANKRLFWDKAGNVIYLEIIKN